MKKYIIKLVVSVLITSSLLSLSSCEDFLTQEPQTALSLEQVFSDINNVQPYLNGVYFAFRRTRYERTGLYPFLGLDETRQGDYQVWTEAQQASMDYYNGMLNKENVCIAACWNVRWPVVIRASQALDALERMEVTDDNQEQISSYIGQAKFYRGAIMFEMVQYWGALPIPTVQNSMISLSARKTIEETYQYIINDLTDAMDRLADTKSSDKRIPTKWAAQAVLARLYMSAWQESGMRDYAKAHELLDDIIQSEKFTLMPNYADLWNPDVNCEQEAIYTFYWGNTDDDVNGLQWHIGSRAASADPNCMFGGYDLVTPSAWAYSKASEIIDGRPGLWEDGDLRYGESIRTEYVYKGTKCTAVTGFGDDQLLPHFKKYEDPRIDGEQSFWQAGKNTYYLRFADILLLDAECLNELDRQPEAIGLVDRVRTRAFGGVLPDGMGCKAGTKEQFLDNLFDERTRELSCEGWRHIDLNRAGLYVKRVNRHNKWAQSTGLLQEGSHFLKWPIPDTEIKTNTNLTDADQNPGY